MKATIINIVIATIFTFTSISSTTAQSLDFFFDRQQENGKTISKTKYKKNDAGLYEKDYLYQYSYNEEGKLTEEEIFRIEAGTSDWTPVYCITYIYDTLQNTISAEYMTWNKKLKRYNTTSDKISYQSDHSGNIIHCFLYDKNSKISTQINCLSNKTQYVSK
jgi:hypothetical protein